MAQDTERRAPMTPEEYERSRISDEIEELLGDHAAQWVLRAAENELERLSRNGFPPGGPFAGWVLEKIEAVYNGFGLYYRDDEKRLQLVYFEAGWGDAYEHEETER